MNDGQHPRITPSGSASQRERHFEIAELVMQHGSVSVEELVERTGVSLMTVYRDIAALEEAGLLQRHRGKVTALATGLHEASATFRMDQQQETKAAMAEFLVNHITPKSSILIDDSTSGVHVIRALHGHGPLTVVTNSLLAAQETTTNPELRLFVLGGSFQGWANAMLGPTTLANLGDIDADFCVISASGLGNGRCFHPYEDVVAVKRAMLDAARAKFLLLDHTKMARKALHAFASLDEFDMVIVDDQTPSASIERLRDWGAKVEIAPTTAQ